GRSRPSKYGLRRACWTAGCPDMRQKPVGERGSLWFPLRANARRHARLAFSEVNSWCTTPSRAAWAVLVEEPEVAVGPLALAGRGDRIGWIVSDDHVEDRHGVGSRALEQGCAPGGRPHRLSVAIAWSFSIFSRLALQSRQRTHRTSLGTARWRFY